MQHGQTFVVNEFGRASDTPKDLSWGSFTENAPWVLDRDNVRWLSLAPGLRSRASAEVPALTTPRRLPPGLRVITVATQIIGALAPWYVNKKRGKFNDVSGSHADVSLRLRKAVEVLGPTYIKLGQIISSGEGLFPAELVSEFKKKGINMIDVNKDDFRARIVKAVDMASMGYDKKDWDRIQAIK